MRVLSLFCVAAAAFAQPVNPVVREIVDNVSEDRITATLKQLESFGTRNTMSEGAVKARQWIYDQFKSYSPRLQVRFDSYKVKKQGRVTRDVEMANVIAVLPGTTNPERQFIISGHYDTLNIRVPDWQAAQETAPAPGVDDDGSGTAAVLELARVMSRHEFEKTIVFIAFVAEEQGLIGGSLYAQKARRENQIIDGVLNNDIIGTAVAGNGRVDNGLVRVFSPEPDDSPARELARDVKDAGERYVPSMIVDLVFRADRFQRGGDHTPFNQEGFAAVRFTTPNENYAHQHSPDDTLANVSVPYLARVARIDAAALASLALAPKAPVVSRNGRPLLGRGPSGYDADLRWDDPNPEPDLAAYAVVIRSTQSPHWEKQIDVGKKMELLIPKYSIDDKIFGVKAIDRDGNESLVAPYTFGTYPRRPIETY